jgi:hypothetical protein
VVPAEPERALVQEILPADEQRTLMAQVAGKRNEALQLLGSLGRRLTKDQTANVGRARYYLTQSKEAENRKDIRQAEAFADLALVLARELNGK